MSGQNNEEALSALVEELDISDTRYEQATRSYQSVGEWLNRPASLLRVFSPSVFIQGSFALGTVVKPISEAEDYDVDLACELVRQSKQRVTQAALKSALGAELEAYAKSKGMQQPEAKRRCWRLNYADGAQFHLDALPAIPDGTRQRLLLEKAGLDASWSDHAVAITDVDHANFETLSDDWPCSNPRGYALWFRSRMAAIFEARRQRIAMIERAHVQKIPEYRVKTPLHRAVQLLKRHRDMRFNDRPDVKPISIIITTLAARSYNGETTIADALRNILLRMTDHVGTHEGVTWIGNPTDPRENFADKWEHNPALESAFREWVDWARADFEELSQLSPRLLLERAAPILGEGPAGRAAARTQGIGNRLRLWNPFSAKHRQTPPWRYDGSARVTIRRATMSRDGFRTSAIRSNAPGLPKGATLTFEADSNVSPPYSVYWQVVNTGDEAEAAGDLRGGFNEGRIEQGYIKRSETTRYSGTHTIECFIVKNNLLVARSGQFLVNIA
jgi:hypothetical protein